MNNQSITRFWDNFISKTKNNGIQPTAVRWYVRHTEGYIKAHSEHRLSNHSSRDVEQYLRDKGRKPHLQNWQYQPLVQAVNIST